MTDYYDESLDLTFSLYENKIMYNPGSGSVSFKKECTEYWFINQSTFTDLEQISEISYIVSGSNSYVKDNNWSGSSNLAFIESDVVNHWYPDDNTKNINDVVVDTMNVHGVNEDVAKQLIKEQFQIIKNWSI